MFNTIDSLDPARWKPTAGPATRAPFHPSGWIGRLWRLVGAQSGPKRELAPSWDDLAGLDAHTLADIGAPDSLQARAMAWRDGQAQERAGLYAGRASGAWRHW